MKYKVTHTTTFRYTTPVSVCHNLVMLSPRDDARTNCRSHRLVIRPSPKILAKRFDYFGNHVHSFSIEENHSQLSVSATSRINVSPAEIPPAETTLDWNAVASAVSDRSDPNWLDAGLFAFNSPRVRRSKKFADYARADFDPGKPVLQGIADLASRVYDDFQYDKEATSVTTATEEAFRVGKGVCQDFAHIQIACLRSLGLSARYVSGYLRTSPPPGKPRLVGADQSHAWVSVYCGGKVGWVDIDPTNNAFCSTDHIAIARGRDYDDVVPIKGVFLGGGEHQLAVSVDVSPIDDPAD